MTTDRPRPNEIVGAQRESIDVRLLEKLYNEKSEYVLRRQDDSFNAQQILNEVLAFKLPNLISVAPSNIGISSIVEVGCATGELIGNFLVDRPGLNRTGFDVSTRNIAAARRRYPEVEFVEQDFCASSRRWDVAILSDVLEHVPDDAGLLRCAGERASMVLVNLPLEDNWLNRNRQYGIGDESGHLRSYTLEDGLSLAARAGLNIVNWKQVWSHETNYDIQRRDLRRRYLGSAFSGNRFLGLVKAAVHFAARRVRPFGRSLYPSNLFFSARID